MNKKENILFTPRTELAVLRRYLHVIALLQNSKDPIDWNAAKFADVISLDEENPDKLSDASILKYIKKYLVNELGLDLEIIKGSRRMELAESLNKKLLQQLGEVYTTFVVKDSSRTTVLKNLFNKHPLDGLWLLARIYFASLEKKKIIFSYKSAVSKEVREYKVNPYHLAFRNNNLYLVCRVHSDSNIISFIVNKIENLKVLNEFFEENVPEIDDVFKDTLGSFLGKKCHVKIRYVKDLHSQIDQIISNLKVEIKDVKGSNKYEALFTVTDDRYLCSQLFLYGDRIEIIEPVELRETMVKMLEESLGMYGMD